MISIIFHYPSLSIPWPSFFQLCHLPLCLSPSVITSALLLVITSTLPIILVSRRQFPNYHLYLHFTSSRSSIIKILQIHQDAQFPHFYTFSLIVYSQFSHFHSCPQFPVTHSNSIVFYSIITHLQTLLLTPLPLYLSFIFTWWNARFSKTQFSA